MHSIKWLCCRLPWGPRKPKTTQYIHFALPFVSSPIAGGGDGMFLNRHHCQESCAVVAWRCWAWSSPMLLSMFSNSWRPVHRRIMRYECCVATDWITRLCSMSIVPPSLLVWHTQPVHGVASSRHPIASASIQWWTVPDALDTARQIHQLLRNCATLQTMICSQKLSGPGPSAAPTTSTVFYCITTLQPQTSWPLTAVTWTPNANFGL